jgi:hypothetical protein
MSAKKREPHKDVAVGGRKWRIGRFDALTGSYITTLLLMQMLPMGLDEQVGLGGMVKGKSLMDKATFLDVQKECLRICYELQPVGGMDAPIPVLLSDDRWGVADIEDDVVTILSLTIHALIFNVSDFFQEDALKDLGQTFSGLNLFNAKE